MALFKIFKLTTSSEHHLEDIRHAHIVSLMYKPLTSRRSSDYLSIGFDWDRGKRQQDITNNKKRKDKFHNRNMLIDVFGFAKHQENATFGLGFKLKATKNEDEAVLGKVVGFADGRNKIGHKNLYVTG